MSAPRCSRYPPGPTRIGRIFFYCEVLMSLPQAQVPPRPVHPPIPSEGTPGDPINVPPPAPEVILPGAEEQPGIPAFPDPDIPTMPAKHI
jgi:hypothetical protein